MTVENHALDDQAEERKSVAVGPSLAGRERQRTRGEQSDELGVGVLRSLLGARSSR